VPNDDESAQLIQHQPIGVPEISVNLLPITTSTTRSSSILNKLISKAQSDAVTTTPKQQYLHIGEIFSILDSKFPQLRRKDVDGDNEISDMVEIEVPLVGNEFAKNYHVDVDRINNEINADGESEEVSNKEIPEGYVEINIAPTTTTTESIEVTDFQSPPAVEATFEDLFETTSSRSHPKDLSSRDMESVESKLMDHWRHLENVGDDFITNRPNDFYLHGFKPRMSVSVYVNSRKKCCDQQSSCKQVRFSKKHDYDILPEYIPADSDEDLFFSSDPKVYFEQKNQLKSRRAADGGFFSSFTSLTPAPRNTMPSVNIPTSFKKPSFFERLEHESSIERTERVNKDLGNLMKFVAVWSHVDKFLSDRARSIVKKIAYLGDDDYTDNFVGSARKNNVAKESVKNSIAIDNEPFT
jgi:hypothetical protein